MRTKTSPEDSILLADGTTRYTKPKVLAKGYMLDELQAIVGGLIEIVYLPHSQIMVVNEEGLLKGLPYNVMASVLAGQHIVGDVLVTHTKRVK